MHLQCHILSQLQLEMLVIALHHIHITAVHSVYHFLHNCIVLLSCNCNACTVQQPTHNSAKNKDMCKNSITVKYLVAATFEVRLKKKISTMQCVCKANKCCASSSCGGVEFVFVFVLVFVHINTVCG